MYIYMYTYIHSRKSIYICLYINYIYNRIIETIQLVYTYGGGGGRQGPPPFNHIILGKAPLCAN